MMRCDAAAVVDLWVADLLQTCSFACRCVSSKLFGWAFQLGSWWLSTRCCNSIFVKRNGSSSG